MNEQMKQTKWGIRPGILCVFTAVMLMMFLLPVHVRAADSKAEIRSPSNQAQYDLGKSVTVKATIKPTPTWNLFGSKNYYIFIRVRHAESTVLYTGLSWKTVSALVPPETSFTPESEGEYQIEAAYFETETDGSLAEEDFSPDDSISIRAIRDLSKSEVEVSGLSELIYTGNALTPDPVVKIGEKTLNPETDYTLSYANNVNVGEASVTVTGKGFYKGSVKGSFQIVPAAITGASVTGITDLSYTGSELIPSPQVVLGGRRLSENTDYEVTCENNTHAGTASVSITGVGNYTGTITKTFRILQVSMVNVTVAGIEDKTYTGSAVTQSPRITYAGKTLVEGTDYTLSFKNNTGPGTATITITGKGDFKDSITRTFSIIESTNSTGSVLQIRDTTQAICEDFNLGEEVWICEYTSVYRYNNGVADPYYYYVRISKGGQRLFFREYAITSPGVYLLERYTPPQKGDYLVEMSLSTYVPKTEAQFSPRWSKTIHVGTGRTDISSGTVTGIVDKEYTGNAITQKVTVKVGAKTLTEGTDYYVTYANNVNVGQAAMAIYGTGNYKGKLNQETTFQITPKTIKASMITLNPTGFTYNGDVRKPEVSVKNGSFLLQEGRDYTLTNEGGTDPGTYSVQVAAKSGSNYTGSAAKNYTIDKLSLAGADLAVSQSVYGYDGSEKQPSVTVTLNGRPVSEENYSVSYRDNINAGRASVIVTANEDSFYTGQASASFTIEKHDLNTSDIHITAPEDVTYNRMARTPAPSVTWGERTLESGTDYTLSYSDNVNAGTASVVMTGTGNYAGSRTASFRILKKDISDDTIVVDAVPDQLFTEGELCQPEIIVRDGSSVLTGEERSITYKDNDREGTAGVTITGTGNYTGTREDVSFRILGRRDYAISQLSDEIASIEEEGSEAYLEADQAALEGALVSARAILADNEASAEELEEVLAELIRVRETARQNLAAYIQQQEAEAAARAAEEARRKAEEARKKAEAAAKAKKARAEALKMPAAAAADKAILKQKTDSDPAGSSYLPLKLTGKKQTKKYNILTWTKVKGASRYIVYGSQCGRKNRIKRLAVVKKTSYKHKGLKKGTYYKYTVVAVKKTVAGERAAAISTMIHVATKGGKVCNPARLTVSVKAGKKYKTISSLTLKKGKTGSLRAKVTPASKKLKLKTHVGVRFESSAPKIASVSKKGVIKARKAGSCLIYVYGQNGIGKRIKVKVR